MSRTSPSVIGTRFNAPIPAEMTPKFDDVSVKEAGCDCAL